MSTNAGNYVPTFQLKLNSQSFNNKILVGGGSGLVTGRVIDSVRNQTTYTGATVGTQYTVQAIPEQFHTNGVIPSITYSSSNTGVSTVDGQGNTTYVSPGAFSVNAIYDVSSLLSGKTISIPLTNSSGFIANATTVSYVPDVINVAQHVLIVYNTNSTDSLNLKNYYTGRRPLFSGANILGISCPSGLESITYSGFTGLIRQPIVNYLTGISGTKPIRYAIMMMDIPTRVSDTDYSSVAHQLNKSYQTLNLRNGIDYYNAPTRFSLGQYQNHTLLSSFINFNNYQDNTGYINKISNGQTGLYLTGNGGNTGYYFEEGGVGNYNYELVSNYNPFSVQFPTVPILFKTSGNHITTGNGVAGYCSFGANGGLGAYYATDGTIKWGGNSNWYLIMTAESYNGQRGHSQGNFLTWFSSGAFGGTGYEKCPVGAVGHTEEPYLGGVNRSGYFILWQTGYPFIECAWQSKATPYFAAFGDPFVCK